MINKRTFYKKKSVLIKKIYLSMNHFIKIFFFIESFIGYSTKFRQRIIKIHI